VTDDGFDGIAHGARGDLRIARRQRIAHRPMLVRARRQAGAVVRRDADRAVAKV
jgi:hypothetical protein